MNVFKKIHELFKIKNEIASYLGIEITHEELVPMEKCKWNMIKEIDDIEILYHHEGEECIFSIKAKRVNVVEHHKYTAIVENDYIYIWDNENKENTTNK